MLLINFKMNLILICSGNCVLSNDTKATAFAITDTKLYFPVVTISTQDNAKLLEQLRSGFKRTINWKKHQLKVSPGRQNQNLQFLIDPSFQVGNILSPLSFEKENDKTVHLKHYLPNVEIKDFNVMINEENVFDQPFKGSVRTYKNIRKSDINQGDNKTTGCQLDHNYFNNYKKMIATDLSKQQVLDADLKAIQQLSF